MSYQPPPPGSPAGPPPGWAVTPPAPYSPYPPPYPPPWGQPPVAKPGIVPLRPLGLGDVYDGAFKAIRQNPKTMVGLAALVTTAFLLVPVLLSVLMAATGNLQLAPDLPGPGSSGGGGSSFTDLGINASQAAGALFTFPATVLLTGICVQVVHRAALGRRTGIGEAWAAARGQLLRLLGLTLLSGVGAVVPILLPVGLGVVLGLTVATWVGVLVGVVGGLAGVLVFLLLQIRLFYLAPATLMLERTGIRAALRRSWTLSRAQFWRLLGIWLVTGLVVGLVTQVLSIPTGLVAVSAIMVAPDSSWAGLLVALAGYLSAVVVGAVTTPFAAGVSALLYLDQRIRKEAYDVELLAASEHRAS